MGLLAWGNSVGDYFMNVAMARKGLANMALTACFTGPVFNLLVTLGVGFLIRLDNFQERRMRVASNDGISVGLGMIIANCVCVVGGRKRDFRRAGGGRGGGSHGKT